MNIKQLSGFLFLLGIIFLCLKHDATNVAAQTQITQNSFSCNTIINVIPQSECNALVALYEDTDGSNWDSNLGWLVTNNPCGWYGITCRNGHVTELRLQGRWVVGNNNDYFGLKGHIPGEIGNLTNLELLNLSYNELETLPAEIGSLSNLTGLYLSGNLSITLPDEIGNLANLERLFINAIDLDVLPDAIWNLSSLQVLRAGANQLTTLSEDVGNLTNLADLDLQHNYSFTTLPDTIGNLSELEDLNLGYTDLVMLPATIGNLSKLRILEAFATQLRALPNEIGNLSSLTVLLLDYNYLSSLPTSLVNLTNLTRLRLGTNCLNVTDRNLLNWMNANDSDWFETQSLERCPSVTATPTPSNPSGTADLIADHIEVTQGIQDLNNSVRLVKDKRTYVRFHVHSNAGTHATTASLTARRGNNQVELSPLNSGGRIRVRTSPDRGTLNHAFLFELPAGYRQGNVTLTATVNPTGSPAESNSNNNNLSVNVNFEPVPDQNVVIAAMGYGNNIYPDDFHQEKVVSWMKKVYPVANYSTDYRDYYFSTGTPSGFDCGQVNAFLQLKRNMDVATGSATEGTRYYGMVDDEGGFMRGCAWIGGNVGSGPAGTSTFGWDNDGSYADWYAVHELNHNYGRRHALFCGASDSTNPSYPHPNGRISPVLTGNRAIYGFDLDTQEIYGPDWSDVMTYCENQWISDFTYEAIMDYFQNSPVVAASATSNRVDRLLVIGTIEPRTNDVRLESLSIIRDAVELRPRVPNGYSIVLRNMAGEELARYGFTPGIIEFGPGLGNEGHSALLGINELVPYVDGTVRVDIEHFRQVIKTVEAGWAVPSVTLDSASGADGLVIEGDTIHLSWSGSDSDPGDTLSYLVQYSSDNGQTWEVMTPYTTDTSARIHVSNIEDVDTALFRIVATDGINTTTSDISSTAQYFSSSTGGRAGTLRFADEDILTFDSDSQTWRMYFDGSDVGLGKWDVDAFHILENGHILLSLDRPRTISGVKYDDSDIIKFTPTSLGGRTRGSFSMYFDGSDVGLTTNAEDIDAIARLANGDLVISTLGTARVTGATAKDEDLLRFHKTRLGNRTVGTWSLYLDGSDIQLSNKNEDIWAVWVDENIEKIHLSTYKNYSAGGLRGDSDDILACDGSVGNNTRCKLSLAWDGDAYSFGSERIDGYSVGPPPMFTVSSAAQDDDESAEDESAEVDDESGDILDDDEYTVHLYLPLISR